MRGGGGEVGFFAIGDDREHVNHADFLQAIEKMYVEQEEDDAAGLIGQILIVVLVIGRKMPIKLLSLNIENHQHLPLVIDLLEKEKPEVICFQEIQEPDFEMFKRRFGFTGFFVPMITHIRTESAKELSVRQGIAFYTTLPLLKQEHFIYFGHGNAPPF